MSDKIKIVFLGSPSFSCPFLENLAHDPRFLVQAVITQEDKPSGRKKILSPTPVKELSLKLGIPVFQPTRLNKDLQLHAYLQELQPDFLVVVAYGQIVSQKVLDIAKIKPVNVHGSLLPFYRGASPIEQALLNGDKETGLSIMEMVLQMDAGPVYATIKEPILPDDTDTTLRDKLSKKGSEVLPDILVQIKNNQLIAQPQVESTATFCQKIAKSDGLIDPLSQTAQQIYNRFRAFIIWPGIYLYLHGKQLKLLELKLLELNINDQVHPETGHFIIDQNRLFLGCQKGCLEVLKLQLEGKTPQTTSVFLQGNKHLFD